MKAIPNNLLIYLWISDGEKDNKDFIISDFSEFDSIILIEELTKENLEEKINPFIEKTKKYSCNKILISIVDENSIGLNDIEKKEEIKFMYTHKDKLLDFIKELLLNPNEEEINELKINAFFGKSKEKESHEISNNLDGKLLHKYKENYEMYSFLFQNDFGEKIFNLFDKLKKYNCKDIEQLYDLITFFHSEMNNLKEIIETLPLITYKDKNAYFASYYYYIIISILNNYNKYKPNKNDESEGSYIQLNDNEEEKKDIINEISDNNGYKEEMSAERSTLENKMNNIKDKILNLYNPYKNLIFDKKIEDNDISKAIDLNILFTKTVNTTLKDIKDEYFKLERIYNKLENYYNKFFRDYLLCMSKFISSINNTYKYFYERIIINKYSDKDNIEDFIDFIYYFTNFNYIENENKLSDFIKYFEDYFSNNEYKDKKWKDSDNNVFEIKNGKLIQTNLIGNSEHVDECENYCLKLIEKEKLTKFQYSNQKYLWFLKFKKNNLLEQNKKVLLDFFLNIFQKKEMKNLMIEVFPILEENYFINKKFIIEFFNKIRAYNFKPYDMCGETISPMLDVYIKSYFDSSQLYESEICALASFVIILLHEFAHYIRIYIYKKTGNTKYRKSIDLCNFKDIGEYLETLLFGKVVHYINLFQALYILDENNYAKNYVTFKKEFMECENSQNVKTIKESFNKMNTFLKRLNIKANVSNIENPNAFFNIKGRSNVFRLGFNNDKKGRPIDPNELFKGTAFEFLINEKNN